MDTSWIEQYQLYVNSLLPSLPKKQGYPVHFNHCWARILLDVYFRDWWKYHLESPAYRNLTETQAKQICQMASLIPGNPHLAQHWNELSKEYRKARRAQTVEQ